MGKSGRRELIAGIYATDCSHPFSLQLSDRTRSVAVNYSLTHNSMIQYLGYFAGVLTVASFLPQVIRTWQTRRTGDLHLGMFTLLVTASALWIVYGVIIGSWPVILTNAGMVALNGALAVAKLRFG
jgi:MtN3 and saliva related transmembrane protein